MSSLIIPRGSVIAYVSSQPSDQDPLKLAEEQRAIRRVTGNYFNLQICPAAQPSDLIDALRDLQPTVLHFSGHGSGPHGLVFQDATGKTKLVSTEALEHVFEEKSLTRNLRLVVLNACWSLEQAREIARKVPVVIAMQDHVYDSTASQLTVKLYEALAKDITVKEAFGQAVAHLNVNDMGDKHAPVILTEPLLDPEILGLKESRWDQLVSALVEENHEFIIILGPLAALSQDGETLLDDLLTDKLKALSTSDTAARSIDWRHMVQILWDDEKTDDSEDKLQKIIKGFYKDLADGGVVSPLHEALADLPLKLIITTSPDPLMENALRACKPPKMPKRHVYSMNRSQKDSDLGDPGVKDPCLYYMQGYWNDQASMLYTPADVVDYTIGIVGTRHLPTKLTSKLRDSSSNVSVVFLGFGFHQWQTRLLLRALLDVKAEMGDGKQGGLSHSRPAFATKHTAFDQEKYFHPESKDETQRYLKSENVVIAHGDPVAFVSELRERWLAAPKPVPRAAPKADFRVLRAFLNEHYKGEVFIDEIWPLFTELLTMDDLKEKDEMHRNLGILTKIQQAGREDELVAKFKTDFPIEAAQAAFYKQ